MSQRRYAYLIGANGPENIRLQYAETDVARLAEVLLGPVCQFTAVEPVIAQSRDEGLATFQQFVEKCDASDTLLVHFSGHAFFDTLDQQLYLLCNNTDSNNLITAIDISAIKRILHRSLAQSKLLILDCCYAKSAYDEAFKGEEEIRDIVKKTAQGSMSAILSACARKAKTQEFRDLDGGSGFLSWAVRAACSTRLEDASSDPEKKALSLSDLNLWMKRALDEVNTNMSLHPPLSIPYLLRDQAAGHEFWFTPPCSPNGNPSNIGNEEKRRRYLNEVAKRYSSVTLPIGSSQGLSLHAIFQPLALRSDPLAAEDLERKQRRKFLEEPAEEKMYDLEEQAKQHEKSRDTNKPALPKIAQHGEEALNTSPQGRIVILGGPGTGKTTTLCYLVSRRAQDALEKAAPNTQTLIPIFLSLADLARSGKTFQSYLHDVVENLMIERSYADVLWAEIERGRAFVALDSLDEVIPALRPQMIEQVNHLAARHGNIWIVGSRFTDYKGGQLKHGQFAEWELLSMTPQLRRELATKLLPELFQLPLAKTSTLLSPLEFVNLLEKHPQAATWGDNPLLFSLAAVVFIKTGSLPSSRSSLYREVIEAILTLKEPESVARRHLQRTLMGLSLWLYQEKKGRTFTTDDLFTFLEEIQKRSWEEAEIIARKITTSGILDIVARETYGFRHQTFQEYLTAAELAQQFISSDEKRAKAYELAWSKRTYSRWTEVLRLMVGVLVQLPGRKGPIAATYWLNKLIKQRETEEGDPGDLGLILALTSLVEIADRTEWGKEKASQVAQLASQMVSLWIEGLLDAVRQQRTTQAWRFQQIAANIAQLNIPGNEVIIEQLIHALRGQDNNAQYTATEILIILGRWMPTKRCLVLLEDPTSKVREASMEILREQKKQVPIVLLLSLLKDCSTKVRTTATWMLIEQKEQVPIERLLSLLKDHNSEVCVFAIRMLAAQGKRMSVEMLRPLLEDYRSEVSLAAAQVLIEQGEQVPVERLLALLEGSNSETRKAAIDIFSRKYMKMPVEMLIPLLRDHDSDVRWATIRALSRQKDQVLVDRLVALLEDPDRRMREAAVWVLRDQKEQVPMERWLVLLEDRDPEVRKVTTKILGEHWEQVPMERWLVLLEDRDPEVRKATTEILGKHWEQVPMERWLVLLEDRDPEVRRVTTEILGEHWEQVPMERWLVLLEDRDPEVRKVTTKILGKHWEQMPMERWLVLLEDRDPEVCRVTTEILGKHWEQVPIKSLLSCMENPDPGVHYAAKEVLGKYWEQMPMENNLSFLQEVLDPLVHRAAAQLLGSLWKLIPTEKWLAWLEDANPYICWEAIKVLDKQGVLVPVERLLPLLEHLRSEIRWATVSMLSKQGERVPVERLLTLLEDPDGWLHSAEIKVLLDKQGDKVPVEGLLALLEHSDQKVRLGTVSVLGKQGIRVPVERLLALLEDRDSWVHYAAKEVLIEQGTRVPVERLLTLLEDPDLSIRSVAIDVLDTQWEQIPVERLLALLEEHNSWVRQSAVWALIKRRERISVEKLLALLEDCDSQVRQSAIWALSEQREQIPVERLLALLEDCDSGVRWVTVQVLGLQGEQIPVERLLALLKDPDSEVQQAVMVALDKQWAQVPVESLLPHLENPDSEVRRVTVCALSKVGERVPIERLFALLEDPDSAVCIITAQILSEQGERVSIERLFALLEDVDWGVRKAAIEVLDKQGERVPIERLLTLLEDVDWEVRKAAIEVLDKQSERVPIERLLTLLEDPYPAVCDVAIKALNKQWGRVPMERLFTLLENPRAGIRQMAVQILGEQGKQIPTERLFALLKDPDSGVNQTTIQVLGKQGEQVLMTLLIPFLYHKNKEIRQAAANILTRSEKLTRSDILLDLVSDEEDEIRQISVHVLENQFPHILPELVTQALSVLDGQATGEVFTTIAQMRLADTIGKHRLASTPFLEKLTELLDWPHWQVRIKAAQALGKIRYNIPDAALQRLFKLRRDPDPKMYAVRDAADDALAEILSLETGIEDD